VGETEQADRAKAPPAVVAAASTNRERLGRGFCAFMAAKYSLGLLAKCRPGLETANKVGRAGQPQPLQGVCSEAGAVALVADHHDPPGGVVSDREPVGAGRSEPPLENIPVNDDRSRKITVAVSLIGRPGVNNKGACCHLPLEIRSVNTLEPEADLKE
jgi:hypothetical protein